MALSSFLGRNNHRGRSIFDPSSPFDSSIFDPREAFAILDGPFLDRSVFGRDFPGGIAGTRVDWVETPEAHVFKADVPGLNKEEAKVEVIDGRTLSITGERRKEKVEEKDAWRCVERSHGKFSRQFALPENAKVEDVSAKVDNGVLTVTVPKAKSEPRKVQSIEVA